jgi:hypothetical protein
VMLAAFVSLWDRIEALQRDRFYVQADFFIP